MDYDIVIVGGRPAGASLAARLGARGIKVLVVDRATFPSLPAVPSSPVLYGSAMALLDELGLDESRYATEDSRMRVLEFNMADQFTVHMRVPPLAGGRDYVYGLDRRLFDDALWRHLERYPSVERREDTAVTDVVREDGRVTGIEVGGGDGKKERITARCVVGADGRFSTIARKVGAEVVEERDRHTSTVYYADWAGIQPAHKEHSGGLVYATARGLDVLSFVMPGGRFCVNTHARSDRVRVDGDPERYYHETLRSIPAVQRYLAGAERVSPVVGVKKISNGYRRASGPGWVLVGDAVHYKDPVDGQGIYDALLEAKLLDRALDAWMSGARSWEAAMSTYWREVVDATHPMFVATTTRLERELYQEPPMPVIRTLIRWTLTDAAYQETFLRVLCRDIPPGSLFSRRLMGGVVARGVLRDLQSLAGRVRGRA